MMFILYVIFLHLQYTPSQSAGDIIGSSIMLVPKKEREQFSIYKGNKKSGVFEVRLARIIRAIVCKVDI